jgi:hypothetical protein
VQFIVDYLICFSSLLLSNEFIVAIWLIIMAKVYHYRCSSLFPLYDID